MLEEVYESYRTLADVIDWKKYNQNELFFEYLNHENDCMSENFYAGIVCRYWGYTGRIFLQCNKHVPFEQCYDILIDTINYVLEKRVWENPESSLFQDKNGPDKAFHMVLKRQRSLLLSNLTAYKRKTNFNTLSIDEIHDKYADAAEGLFDIYSTSERDWELTDFIERRKNTLDIIILDRICFTNWRSFRNVVKQIKKINENDREYYNINYNISSDKFNETITKISKLSDSKLLFEVKKLLYLLKVEDNV